MSLSPSGRVYRCPKCKRTFDLAIIIPRLQSGKGRLLTDEEMAEVHEGAFHNCLGEEQLDFREEDELEPQFAKTQYDWRTYGKT